MVLAETVDRLVGVHNLCLTMVCVCQAVPPMPFSASLFRSSFIPSRGRSPQRVPFTAGPALHLLRASLLGGTALALLIGAGSGAWAQSVEGGAATGANSLAVGIQAKAYSQSSTALGNSSVAGSSDPAQNGDYTTALGAGASATAAYSTAVGDIAIASGDNSSAMGYNARAYGQDATAVGASAVAGVAGDRSVIQVTALGALAQATASNATALGYNAQATARNTTALGYNATAITDSSIALGVDSRAGSLSGLLGESPPIPTTRAVAIGPGAMAFGQSSVAIGDTALVQKFASGGVAIGNNAIASVVNSVALGADSITQSGSVSSAVQFSNSSQKIYTFAGVDQTYMNEFRTTVGVVSVGGQALENGGFATRLIQFVAPGRLSADSTDAVNGSQLDATNTALSRILGTNNGLAKPGLSGDNIEAASSLALGIDSLAGVSGNTTTDYYATALGVGSKATGRDTTAVGAGSSASADYATAMGKGSQATGSGSTALGVNSSALATTATALGYAAQAQTARSTSVGATSKALGDFSTALGFSSQANYTFATALGAGATAAQDATAVGKGAQADAARSVALGTYSVTGSVNTASSITLGAQTYGFSGALNVAVLSIGGGSVDGATLTRQIQNVAPGLLASTSTDAVNGSQLWAIQKAMGAVVTADAADASKFAVSVGTFETDGTITARKIQNVANGALSATSTDGVNGSQLFATNQAVTTLDAKVDQNNVDVNNRIDTTDAKIGAVVSGSDVSVADRVTGNARKVLGVANGSLSATSTDGVNGSQLFATNQAVTTLDAKVDQNNVDVNNRIDTTDAKIGAVVSGSDVSVADRVTGAARKVLGVVNGSLSATSTDGVNGSQLYATNQAVVATNIRIDPFYAANVAIGSNSVTGLAHASSSITFGATTYAFQAPATSSANVFSVGRAGAERQIQNVAAGLLSSTSTDAVNGSQLYATNQALTAILGRNYGINSGSTSLALGLRSVAGPVGNTTRDYFATAVGVTSQATGQGATAFGYNSSASGQRATALGLLSFASADDASSIGAYSSATSTGATAIGVASKADGASSIAIGLNGEATGSQSIAIYPRNQRPDGPRGHGRGVLSGPVAAPAPGRCRGAGLGASPVVHGAKPVPFFKDFRA